VTAGAMTSSDEEVKLDAEQLIDKLTANDDVSTVRESVQTCSDRHRSFCSLY